MSAFHARRREAAPYDLIAPERRAPARMRPPLPPRDGVVDAEFVTIRETPGEPVPPSHGNDNARTVAAAAPRAAADWAQRLLARAEKALLRMPADMFSALVAAIFVTVFVLAGGLSGLSADEAGRPAGNPLDITHVSLTPHEANGMKLLLVNGIVENAGPGRMAIPPIRADLVSSGTLLASTVIAPPATEIEAGHSLGFSARLSHPGGKTPELRLSFAGTDAPRL